MPRLKHRPRLLPKEHWARVALVLMVLFTLIRGVLWASTQPAWFAPDEDYHWLYTEYLLIEKSWPHLDRPFATQELYFSALATEQGQYYPGPRHVYNGDPRRSLRELEQWPGLREATGEPPRQVLHPPLYHLGAALVDRVVTWELAPVRLTAIRYYSACLGALMVFLAWLLAAQILNRPWQQLAVPALVATQPMLAFSSATASNDILTACTFTAVLAWCAWLLRSRPDRRQGYGLGLLLGLALLSKSTGLVLFGIAALTLLLLWRTWPQLDGAVRGLALRAAAVTAMIAGWWYVVLWTETGSLLGTEGSVASASLSPPIAAARLWFVDLGTAWDWIRDAYSTYWVFQFPHELGPLDGWELVPLGAAAVGLAGLFVLLKRTRRTVSDPARPVLRQALVLAAAPIGVTLPFFLLDMKRHDEGLSFLVATGRFSLAAYAAVATLFVVALRELSGGRSRLQYVAIGAAVALSFAYYVHTYAVWGLERYYGPLDGVLSRAIWDKPRWVTEGFLEALIVLGGITALGALVTVIIGNRRPIAQAANGLSSPQAPEANVRSAFAAQRPARAPRDP